MGIISEYVRNLIGKQVDDHGIDAAAGAELHDLRQRLARHVVMTDFISDLGDAVPSKLASVPVATSPASRDACMALARAWRLRRARRETYVAAGENRSDNRHIKG